MFIHIGVSLYGKVDQVPGLLHVATQFIHLSFIPVVPKQSYVVLAGTEKGDKFEGCPIGFSGKSILFAWLRCFLLIGGIVAGVIAFITSQRGPRLAADAWHPFPVLLALSAAAFILLVVSYRITRARPLRALELARLAGISPEVLAGYFASHDPDALTQELRQE